MTDPAGYILLWRKIEESWQWQNPKYRAAWIWLVLKAAYSSHNGLSRGQCYFTLSQSQIHWGMNKDQARRFIRRCVQECDIIWEPGRPGVKASGGATSTATSTATSSDTCRGKITLRKYDEYNPTETAAATSSDTSELGSGVPIEKQSIRTKDKNSLSNSLSKKLQIELLKPGLKSDAEEYPNIDVPKEFKKWQNWMEAKGKFPKKYSASWSNWLIKAEEIRLEKLPKNRGLSSAKRKEFGLD